jgi:hypothetical protein
LRRAAERLLGKGSTAAMMHNPAAVGQRNSDAPSR